MGKKVLVVAYYFPPMGGAGTQRSAKFVKYLPELGWEPVVVTGKAEGYEVSREFQFDGDLKVEADSYGAKVYRIRDPFPKALRNRRFFKYLWMLRYQDLWEAQVPWSRAAAARCLRIAQSEQVDAVYTSLAPFSAAIVGHRLKTRLGIPWIADLRDLWTEEALRIWPTKMHYDWERRLERRLLSAADRIVANTELSRRRLVDHLRVDEGRVSVVTNGFDSEDFEDVSAAADPERFVLTHVGTFRDHTRRATPLAAPLYVPALADESVRSPLYILQAVRRLLQRFPDLESKLCVRLVGYLSPVNRELVEAFGLEEIVQSTGYVGHRRVIAELVRSDALLLSQVTYSDRERPVPFVPGKVYEYFAAGKPILALLPPGDARDLVVRSGVGFLPPCADPEAIADVLEEMIRRWEKGDMGVKPDKAFVARFERRALTKQLAEILGSAVGEGGEG